MKDRLREKLARGRALTEEETKQVVDECRLDVRPVDAYRRASAKREAKYGQAYKAADRYLEKKNQAHQKVLKDPLSTVAEVCRASDEWLAAVWAYEHISDLFYRGKVGETPRSKSDKGLVKQFLKLAA